MQAPGLNSEDQIIAIYFPSFPTSLPPSLHLPGITQMITSFQVRRKRYKWGAGAGRVESYYNGQPMNPLFLWLMWSLNGYQSIGSDGHCDVIPHIKSGSKQNYHLIIMLTKVLNKWSKPAHQSIYYLEIIRMILWMKWITNNTTR